MYGMLLESVQHFVQVSFCFFFGLFLIVIGFRKIEFTFEKKCSKDYELEFERDRGEFENPCHHKK